MPFHRYIPDCMSSRPEYYSGRGATTSDLNSGTLEKIHHNINGLAGPAAAAQFTYMVADLPTLSATDFLIALQSLEFANWEWTPRSRPSSNGIEVVNRQDGSDFGHNMGTIVSVLFGMNNRDETESIRGSFLREHEDELPLSFREARRKALREQQTTYAYSRDARRRY